MRVLMLWLLIFSAVAHADTLDDLFQRLADTESSQQAATIEQVIWTIWMQGPDEDDSAALRQAVKNMNQGEWTLALMRLDRLIEASPDYTEAWNKRATIHFMLGQFDESVADIEETLKREPRHFGAWSGLGLIMEHTGQLRAALAAHQEVLRLYPASQSSQQRIEAIRAKLLDQSI